MQNQRYQNITLDIWELPDVSIPNSIASFVNTDVFEISINNCQIQIRCHPYSILDRLGYNEIQRKFNKLTNSLF